ncbi:MAG: hypothetical protein D6696_14655 [Acidobacteria bacterium]|nr:MAG: hypothetical protein D6696_14655 [Acidobacteriota bacterium]
MDQNRKNRIAQWVYDTGPVLERFHLWLEDVEETAAGPDGISTSPSFVGAALERAFVTSAAVTAIGTYLFGRYGEGRDADKAQLNRIKKHADAVSAYAMSEAIWHLTRNLPENHAVMVSLGEGLMPKAGETPEMGSNPLLGFGRVYARPAVARFLDRCVHRLLNHPTYDWEDFWREVGEARVTVWGAAIDTLENTSRFAKGEPSGPMTVLHLFDQPLQVSTPYEGYVGTLVVPREVVEQAAQRSILLTYRTPRERVLAAIRGAYPDVPPERVHVWTLGGAARIPRIGSLWQQWRDLGVHLVEDGWPVPGGGAAFTDAGTYGPLARVGVYRQDGQRHVFLCDGYAASAEAIQGASLDPILGTHSALAVFSSRFALSWEQEPEIMRLDPESGDFAAAFRRLAGEAFDPALVEPYRESLRAARRAGIPCDRHALTVDDFFPRKKWRVLALAGRILADPYTGEPGVERVGDRTYRVVVRAATRHRLRSVALTLRLRESMEQSRLIFLPLLERFYAGQDYRTRPVKVSDSGRLRNELQTLCSDALDHVGSDGIRVHFERIDDAVMPPDKKALIRQVLTWYKENHPIWFRWLELAD